MTIKTAAEERRQHIEKSNTAIARLTAAVEALKANTANIKADDWNWVGDWQSTSHQIEKVADLIESMARTSARRA